MNSIATYINQLGAFLAKRDIPKLNKQELQHKYHIQQADVMVLFGGSILCGGDVLAHAMEEDVAKHYVIVGGAGHTTQTLREKMHAEVPEIVTEESTEAEIFANYINHRYGYTVDNLETKSTNCGNNITLLLDLLNQKGIECNNIILTQDGTMQHRMEATLKKYRPDMNIINYAAYQVEVVDDLTYKTTPWGMWDMDRYVELLLGEIPRLTDDEHGYGPKGQGFIAHVDIPEDVREAFTQLSDNYTVRVANPAFADK